jgi:CRISPR-associated protein Cas2
MLDIVTGYDVSVVTENGPRRLRRVAKVCERYGQRVQQSVSECEVNVMQFDDLERSLLAAVDLEVDNLRFYPITEPHERRVKQFGVFRSIDFDAPLVV